MLSLYRLWDDLILNDRILFLFSFVFIFSPSCFDALLGSNNNITKVFEYPAKRLIFCNIFYASSGHAFDLIGISPLRGSHRDALLGCDGSRISPLQRSTWDWTQVSFFFLFSPRSGCTALFGSLIPLACPIRGRQKKRKRCVNLFIFQKRESLLLYMPKFNRLAHPKTEIT